MSLDRILADAKVEYVRQSDGRYKIVVPKADPKHVHVRLSNSPQKDIIRTLNSNPGCGIGYICRKTGIPRERAHRLIDEMIKSKKIHCQIIQKKSRSYTQYYPI
jgi:hypothetical protein